MSNVNRVFFSEKEKYEISNKSEGRCAHCGQLMSVEEMTVDHVYPLSKGGTNNPINLVILCEKCNKEKRDMLIRPSNYYKYIDPITLSEIMSYYMLKSYVAAHNTKATNRFFSLMQEESRIYNIGLAQKSYNAWRDGRLIKNNKSIKNMKYLLKTLTTVIKVEHALERDAEDIVRYIKNQVSKTAKHGFNIENNSFCNVQYIKSLITYGDVYTLKMLDGTIKGVLGFKNLTRDRIELPVQAKNFEEETGAKIVYALVLGMADLHKFISLNEIMVDFYFDFYLARIAPVDFTTSLSMLIIEGGSNEKDKLNILTNIDGVEGTLTFLKPGKYIKTRASIIARDEFGVSPLDTIDDLLKDQTSEGKIALENKIIEISEAPISNITKGIEIDRS